VGCLGDSMELLEQALQLLDWRRGVYCTSMRTRYFETVLKVVRDKQLDIDLELVANLYHLSREKALQLPIE